MKLTFEEALDQHLREFDRRCQAARLVLANHTAATEYDHQKTLEAIQYQAREIIKLKQVWDVVRRANKKADAPESKPITNEIPF